MLGPRGLHTEQKIRLAPGLSITDAHQFGTGFLISGIHKTGRSTCTAFDRNRTAQADELLDGFRGCSNTGFRRCCLNRY